jgi:Catalase
MTVAPGTGWQETYMSGSPEAERSLLADVLPRIEQIQATVSSRQSAQIRRAFHNKGLPILVRFEVTADLPEALRIGFLKPGAVYEGFGRFSRSQSYRKADGDLDQRGFAFRIETDLGRQDVLLSNTPVSFARDPVMFMVVASIFVESSLLVAPLKLIRALGPADAIRVMANLLRPPERRIAFTAQRYWSRTPFQFGDSAARLFVRPEGPVRRVEASGDPDFLTTDLADELRQQPRAFELCAQLFVDEARTPIEDASRLWAEDVAPPIVLGRLILPIQDLDGAAARDLAERVESAEAFSPWNTPCLRPLGRTNRARREAYRRSAVNRGALSDRQAASSAVSEGT